MQPRAGDNVRSALVQRAILEQRKSAKVACAVCRTHAWDWETHLFHTCPEFHLRQERHSDMFAEALERRNASHRRRFTDWRTDPKAYRRRWQD